MTTLSRRQEIAIAILVACARNDFSWTRTEDAAIAAQTSKEQAAQVVHALMLAGLIETQQGRHGGIRLKLRPEQVTLGIVLNGIGVRKRLAASLPAVRRNEPLFAIAKAADMRARQTFESFTIADLAQEQVAGKLTCFDCSIRLGVVERMHIPRQPAGQRASA